MTGDGVNDALALKDADIGVAMGTGADATRAVAQLVLLDSTFDALPSVVSEGRRVLGNIERTSNLYLTKTVYAMLLSLAVGVAGTVFPFLPRHLTLIGALTIGIPSFFLALAPSARRFRPGFVHRVLRFTIPAGFLAATATFLGYTLATREPGVTTLEAQTTAVMTLMWVGLLVLSIVAAPLNTWRLVLVWSMGVAAVLAFVAPGDADVLRAGSAAADGVARVDRDRGADVDVRAVLRAGGTADRHAVARRERLEAGPVRLRPDDDPRLADDVVPRDEPDPRHLLRIGDHAEPEPRVLRVLAVVAHHEVHVGGHLHRDRMSDVAPLAVRLVDRDAVHEDLAVLARRPCRPGVPITRLMKSSSSGFWNPIPWKSQCAAPPMRLRCGCLLGSGSVNTMMSPRCGSWR